MFWAKVDRSGGPDACWLWLGRIDKDGYGQLYWKGKRTRAHRVAFEIANGKIADGLCACHSCDARYQIGDTTYRRCCNPKHVWPGTNAQNSTDCANKGRHGKGEMSYRRMHPERYAGAIGSGNAQAKLTEDDVRAIRQKRLTGKTYAALAAEFSVSASLIRDVVKRKLWRHVEDGASNAT